MVSTTCMSRGKLALIYFFGAALGILTRQHLIETLPFSFRAADRPDDQSHQTQHVTTPLPGDIIDI